MWGQILVESSIQQNFNFGFSTHKSDILLHLSQWQYWWWFWFSLVWVAYYYIIIYCITKRTFLFNPVLNTSIRGHGKWGDFLVAIIPLSWCGNILVNSNFILRMIEWQNESSLFTLRIQGKQWYWVYKFDATAATAFIAAPKNLGNSKWLTWTPNDVHISDSYYQAIHLAAKLEFQDTYKTLLDKANNTKSALEVTSLATNKIFAPTYSGYNSSNLTHKFGFLSTKPYAKLSNIINFGSSGETYKFFLSTYASLLNKLYANNFGELSLKYTVQENYQIANYFTHYESTKLDDTSDTMGNLRLANVAVPFRFLKNPINLYKLSQIIQNTGDYTLFSSKLSGNNDAVDSKVYQTETLWGFRQKKYKRLKKFLFINKFNYNPETYKPTLSKSAIFSSQRNIVSSQVVDLKNNENLVYSYKQFNKLDLTNTLRQQTVNSTQVYNDLDLINKTRFFNKQTSSAFDYYKAIKNSKHRSDLLSVTLARRLLRVKRTLVLPAHVNITVVTNSYDVVHSWFIPGLGIKLDCVPGRSTHHTFYVDNIGFYYGQCAEICGRYHHHMPIRICALSFEQFLVWWHKKGLPRLNRLNVQGQNANATEKYYNYLNLQNKSDKYPSTPVSTFTTYKYTW